MEHQEESLFKEPGTKFRNLWNLGRQHSQAKIQIQSIIEQSQRREIRMRRIRLFSIAASILICAGLITLFQPFNFKSGGREMVNKGQTEGVITVPVNPSKSPLYKASSDTFHRGDGTMLKWKADSIKTYRFDFHLKVPGISQ